MSSSSVGGRPSADGLGNPLECGVLSARQHIPLSESILRLHARDLITPCCGQLLRWHVRFEGGLSDVMLITEPCKL